ncbi:MAG: hypothetical protein N4A68_06615 [Maledivibacter sp.]|jgi:hypothetical protein|nr:hypothetical protein [Maledivibacter sp.]
MMEIFLMLLGFGYLIYKIAIEIPRDIKRVEEKVDILKLHLQEISIKMDKINDRGGNK